LLEADGTGKTFTITNIIEEVNKLNIFLAHNKILTGQLYEKLQKLFSILFFYRNTYKSSLFLCILILFNRLKKHKKIK